MDDRRSGPGPLPEPRLVIPLRAADQALVERINLGLALLKEWSAVQDMDDFGQLVSKYLTWHEFNSSWIKRYIGRVVAIEYGQ